MDAVHSVTSRNLFGEALAAKGWSVEDLSAMTGVSAESLQRLAREERLLPEPVELGAACMALNLPLDGLLRFDPQPAASLSALLASPGEKPSTEPVQVTVCGAGNLGHVFAGLLSQRPELRVNWLTSSDERARMISERASAQQGIRVLQRSGETRGMPARISADPAEAVRGSKVVLLCLPSHVEPGVLERIAPHLEDGVLIGAIPGPGGFHWAAQRALAKVNKRGTVFGLASIPWMCKSDEHGRSVRILGTKTLTGLVALPSADAARAREVVSALLRIPVLGIRSFLEIILNPANQLLHPGIMFDLFGPNWDGKPVAEQPLFYESISENAAQVLETMSDETLRLREALEARCPGLSLDGVLPIALAINAAYGADIGDVSSLRTIIASNRAYAGIRTPMVRVDGGLLPDWNSRFFLEDIPFGLVVLRGIADLVGVTTPLIDEVILWAQQRMDREYLVNGELRGKDVASSGAPQRYGITRAEQLFAEDPASC